jgi:hypothetical protein
MPKHQAPDEESLPENSVCDESNDPTWLLDATEELELDVASAAESGVNRMPRICIPVQTLLFGVSIWCGLMQWTTMHARVALATLWLLWVGRSVVHTVAGYLEPPATDEPAPLRKWLIAEWILAVAAAAGLLSTDLWLPTEPGHDVVLLLFACGIWIISRAEALKIEAQVDSGQAPYQTGKAWLRKQLIDRLALSLLAPLFDRSNLAKGLAISLVAMGLIGLLPPVHLTAIWTVLHRDKSGKAIAAPQRSIAPVNTKSPSAAAKSSPVPASQPAGSSAPPSVASPAQHMETYDEECVLPGKGPEPGFGAAQWASTLLYAFVLQPPDGIGGKVTGCLQPSQSATSRTYFQIGLDEDNGSFKSVLFTTQGCGTSYATGQEARSLLTLLQAGYPLCSSGRHAVGSGDAELLDSPAGTFALVRTGTTGSGSENPYITMSPAEASAWYSAELRAHRWLWPRRNGGRVTLSDQDGPVDFTIIDNGDSSARLRHDGSDQPYLPGAHLSWQQLQSLANSAP